MHVPTPASPPRTAMNRQDGRMRTRTLGNVDVGEKIFAFGGGVDEVAFDARPGIADFRNRKPPLGAAAGDQSKKQECRKLGTTAHGRAMPLPHLCWEWSRGAMEH